MLQTERLTLRRLRADDRDTLSGIFGDPVVMSHVGAGRPLDAAEVTAMLERIAARFAVDGFGQLGIERRSDGRLIGRAGLLPLDPETWQAGSRAELGPGCEIEIGWTLDREAWGQGYATEAARAIRDVARDALGLTRLVAIIQLGNTRSVRVAEKLGAVPERQITTAFGKPAWLYALALDPGGSRSDGLLPPGLDLPAPEKEQAVNDRPALERSVSRAIRPGRSSPPHQGDRRIDG